nr:MAG TPA: hypothetical protein [Caudoviricetes sp.]
MFNKESKEEKDARKTAELMQKYGLDYISEKDKESIKKILSNLVGTGMMKTGYTLSLGKAEEQVKMAYLYALMEQNWIIIRQLDRISNLLDKD